MFGKKKNHAPEIDKQRIPAHIAVIMDGNGRWAKSKMMPRALGHRYGVEALRKIIQHCDDIGVKVLSVYAFSTENWKRPSEEVSALMGLLVQYFRSEIDELHRKRAKIVVMGELDALPEEPRQAVRDAIAKTKDNTGLVINIALNYGSRTEIVRAAKRVIADAVAGKMNLEALDEDVFASYLYTSGLPDPDLIIRTSGEQRLSNFLLYQAAYSEFYFTARLWPDFDEAALDEAIAAYQNRSRRYGGL